MITLLAVLTIAAQIVVVTIAAAALVSRWGVRGPLERVERLLAADALRLAWLVAFIAMAGSLYMSEIRHFLPCPLCWYQRIAMYPLVVVLGVAVLVDDRRVWRTAVPLAAIGLGISTYHWQLERFPEQEAIACSKAVPCTTIWFQEFGYITISMMALSAFALVIALVTIGRKHHGQGIPNEA